MAYQYSPGGSLWSSRVWPECHWRGCHFSQHISAHVQSQIVAFITSEQHRSRLAKCGTSCAKISSGTCRVISFSACATGRPRHAASSPLQDSPIRHPCCQRSCRLRCICGFHGDSVVYHGAFAWRVTWNNRLTTKGTGDYELCRVPIFHSEKSGYRTN